MPKYVPLAIAVTALMLVGAGGAVRTRTPSTTKGTSRPRRT